jgi:O-antigen/teichoic acid export membrane protein
MRNSALAFAPQALAVVTGIASSVITARYLGPDGRGALSIVLVALVVLAMVADLGLGHAVTYFVSKGQLNASRALAFCVYAALIPGLVVAAVAVFAWPAVSANVMQGVTLPTFQVAVLALPAMLFVTLWTRMEMALQRFSTTMLFQSVQTAGLLAVTIGVLLVARRGVHELVVATVVVWVVTAIAMGLASAYRHGFDPRVPRDVLAKIRSYALRAYPGGIVNYSTLRFDLFVLNAYAGNAAVGHYSMAVTLTEKLWLIDSAVGQATMPEVISRGPREAAELIAATCRTVVLVTTVVGGALGLLAPLVIKLLYGDAFLPAATPLRILIPGVVLFAASRIIGQYQSGQLGRPGLMSTVSLVVAVASLALYVALVPPYGSVGAAVASVIAYSIGFMINVALFRHFTGIGLRRVLIPTAEEVRRVLGMFGAVGRRLAAPRS